MAQSSPRVLAQAQAFTARISGRGGYHGLRMSPGHFAHAGVVTVLAVLLVEAVAFVQRRLFRTSIGQGGGLGRAAVFPIWHLAVGFGRFGASIGQYARGLRAIGQNRFLTVQHVSSIG